jgi:hypothetical protein
MYYIYIYVCYKVVGHPRSIAKLVPIAQKNQGLMVDISTVFMELRTNITRGVDHILLGFRPSAFNMTHLFWFNHHAKWC